ncbi:right-handed parallel beta-helix repeat-containing protein [Paenibacillus cymbidii]|uniref:right-handed parallel beta-helix repeat-containing protein n=1 Tax=Paenibacillus cymbidii TaxID=1639034 RepID=UPI001081C888|nr:right-handed parallel beta-helix repeat-containing protein [Paenibacillus cymbidii]
MTIRGVRMLFYIAPNGNDGGPGTEESPFRTLARARDAVRECKRSMIGDIVVYLRGGVYRMAETAMFDDRDSGTDGHRVTYRAYPGETPVLSGGVELGGWSKAGQLLYKCDAGTLRFRQLYVNGERAIRARTPNKGNYFRLLRWDRDNREIVIDRSQIGDWPHLDQVEMVVQQYWAESTVRLAGFTVHGNEARVKLQETEADILFVRPHPPHAQGQPFHFENALAFADAEGEWYKAADSGDLYYIPRAGEDMATAETVAPMLETLVSVAGTPDRPVRDLVFEGITFMHTGWQRPNECGNLTLQAGQYNLFADANDNQRVGRPPAGAYVACAQRVRFERCEFRHMGATALDFHYGTSGCEAEGNIVADVSGNGISLGKFNDPEGNIGDAYNPSDLREVSTGDRIANNVVRRVGLDYYGSIGIAAGYVKNAVIEHNDLADLPYTGISLGWGWLHTDSASSCNRIVRNRIAFSMTQLCDGAGIYTLSKQPGSEISGNLVTDIKRSEWAGSFPISAIYLDEGSEGFRIFNNYSRYSTPEDVHLHRTGDNVIANYAASPDRVAAEAGLTEAYRDLLEHAAAAGREAEA